MAVITTSRSAPARDVAPSPTSILSLTQPCPLCNIDEWTLVRSTDMLHDHRWPFERRYYNTATRTREKAGDDQYPSHIAEPESRPEAQTQRGEQH